MDLERPDRIVLKGPYARSRNPMYVAWTLVYVGTAFVVSTAWPMVLLPVVLLLTHVVVVGEERFLEVRFGARVPELQDLGSPIPLSEVQHPTEPYRDGIARWYCVVG